MRSQTTYQPLQEYLEHRCVDEGVEQANRRIIHIPKTSNPDLADKKDSKRTKVEGQTRLAGQNINLHKEGDECRRPDRYNVRTQWIWIMNVKGCYCDKAEVTYKQIVDIPPRHFENIPETNDWEQDEPRRRRGLWHP